MSASRTITDLLIKHNNEQPLSFHVPGHKGRDELIRRSGFSAFCDGMYAADITEIAGDGSILAPTGIIADLAERYAQSYGAKSSALLTGGASAGIIAAILSSVPFGGKLVLGRNSQFAAFSAMRLGKIVPVYLRPEIEDTCKMQSVIDPETVKYALYDNPTAKAVFITSPNYYGCVSDIAAIADVCHDAGAILIVDQSNGAHLTYFDRTGTRQRAAENLGADIVINETYRSLLSITGTGILNICSDDVDESALIEQLNMLQTDCPSYNLLASLDINEQIMRRWGEELVQRWKDDVTYFFRKAKKINGLDILEGSHLDMTMLNISMASLGLSGDKLERLLRHKGVWAEMSHGDYVLLETGAGNIRTDYDGLLGVLEEIATEYAIGKVHRPMRALPVEFELEVRDIPMRKEKLPLYMADGRVLHSPIVCYPPGSPLACPGEVMDIEIITYISEALRRGESLIGVDDEGEILVGAE